MPLAARRVFRLGLTTALTLAIAYGFPIPFPYVAAIFAFIITSVPSLRFTLKKLIVLIVLILLTLSIGILITPLILYYPVSGIMIVGVGIYFSTYLTVNLEKGLVGTLLSLGFTIVPAAGAVDYQVTTALIQALSIGMAVAIISQWIVYPFFPEDDHAPKPKPANKNKTQCNWIAIRVSLIVLPAFVLALVSPAIFFKTIIKSILLGKQGTEVDAKHAGRELIGSTLLGGVYAIAFWALLKIETNIWMFFLWATLFSTHLAAKLFQVSPSQFTPSFWQNVAVTMILLLGLGIQHNGDGGNVYQDFFERMAIFLGLAFYTWGAVYFLDSLKEKFSKPKNNLPQESHYVS